nr:EOG090X07UV [Ceriodaphnia reticulata]
MTDRRQLREATRIFILCVFWYLISSSNNVIGKLVLNEFPYPMTLTMVQLLSISLYSGPFLKIWNIRPGLQSSFSKDYYWKLIIPLAFGKFLSSVFSHISIWKVPVSFAHTVKASMPLFTVVLSRILMGEKQTLPVYLSLIPIILGVAVATVTEISFDLIGMWSALVATCGFSLQNIFSKKVLHDTGVHHLRLLHMLGQLALLMFTPVWAIFDLWKIIQHTNIEQDTNMFMIFSYLFLDGLLNWLQNVVAFSLLHLVSPLTYAVANASKRIAVISFSLFMLRNPVTGTNVFGMALAIFGVLYYNKAKYDANLKKKKLTVLPLVDHSNGGVSVGHKFALNRSFQHI